MTRVVSDSSTDHRYEWLEISSEVFFYIFKSYYINYLPVEQLKQSHPVLSMTLKIKLDVQESPH